MELHPGHDDRVDGEMEYFYRVANIQSGEPLPKFVDTVLDYDARNLLFVSLLRHGEVPRPPVTKSGHRDESEMIVIYSKSVTCQD